MLKKTKDKEKLTVEEVVHSLQFATSMEAWEKVNEMFIYHDKKLFGSGSSHTSGMSAVFNVFIKIRKAWVDPDFDYGKMFNYREQKWTTLVNNYLNLNKLDLLRSKVRYFQSKYNQNYNISYSFDNAHDNGKGCLLAATFSRRLNEDIPVITIMIRSSEITKRLIFDLLLVQRMGEYVYGENMTFMINIFATQMYCNTETLVMYNTHRPLKDVLVSKGYPTKSSKWIRALMETYDKFMADPKSFSSYKVFLRTAKCLRPDVFHGSYKPLLAKDMKLEYDDIEYPEECITLSQRKQFKKKLKK
jgi:hypothetical protein